MPSAYLVEADKDLLDTAGDVAVVSVEEFSGLKTVMFGSVVFTE